MAKAHRLNFVCVAVAALLSCATAMHDCTFSPTSGFCREVSGRTFFPDSNTYIRALYIVDSDLTELTDKDFARFQSLSTLHINNCTVPLLEGSSVLADLKHLQTLQITYSNLSTELSAFFSNTLELSNLSLQWNKLVRISNAFFSHLKEVESIDVSHNAITKVEHGAFSGLPGLKKVVLSHNDIGEHFDPSYLSPEPEEKCPEGDLRCEANDAVDALWRALGAKGVALFLDGNPVCSKVGEEPVPGEEAAAGRLQFLRDACVPESERSQETEEQAEEGQEEEAQEEESKEEGVVEEDLEAVEPAPSPEREDVGVQAKPAGADVEVRMKKAGTSEANGDRSETPLWAGVALGLSVGFCCGALFIFAVVLILRGREKQGQTNPQHSDENSVVISLENFRREDGSAATPETS